MRWLKLSITHLIALAVGFALGIYLLPILIAPNSVERTMLESSAKSAQYSTELTKDLEGSDFLHWGEGTISVGSKQIVHQGKLAPGPDYKLYLVKNFVENEEQFLKVKEASQYIGDVKTFDGVILDVPANVDIEQYSTALIWCETFGEFITAAKYK